MKKFLFLALLAVIATGTFHYVKAQKTSLTIRFTNSTLTLVNNAAACCYRAVFIQNGVEHSYLFPSSGSTSFGAVLAPGTYTLGVAPIGGSSATHSFSYSSGPDYGSQTGTSATFNNVTVYSGGSVTVSIN